MSAGVVSSVERGAAPKELFAGRVFLVGNRYGHHARHSGYEGFQRYLGNPLKPPLGFRFLKVKNFPMLGWRIDWTFQGCLKATFVET